jgi:hypothetical protein
MSKSPASAVVVIVALKMKGLREDGVRLDAVTLARLAAIEGYDLTFCHDRWVEKTHGLIGRDDVELAAGELKRFLALPLIFPGTMIFPPTRIDACWHEFILYTAHYRQFCREMLGREYFDHNPQPPIDPLQDGPMHTLALYRRAFGPPPMYMWGPISRDEERWLLYRHAFPDLAARPQRGNPLLIFGLAAGLAVLIREARRRVCGTLLDESPNDPTTPLTGASAIDNSRRQR